MTKPKILSTRPLFPAARTILDQHFEVEYWTPPERISREELLKRVADKEGLVCLLTEKVDEELLSAAPKLRIAATVSVGYDNIDVAACTRHKVVATQHAGSARRHDRGFCVDTADGHRATVARGRRLDAQRNLAGVGPRPTCGRRRVGKNTGILGFGRIGRGVARRALGFHMRVLYNDAVRASADVEKRIERANSWTATRCSANRILSACMCRCCLIRAI